MAEFTKAWDNLNLCPVDIYDPPVTRNGLKCVECGEPVLACQGEERSWYFRHQSSNCSGGPMTALHLLSQHLLKGDHTILTKEGNVSYSGGELEYIIPGSLFRADVAGNEQNGSKFLIEIFVNHELEVLKVKHIKEIKMHAIEINLSDVDPDIRTEDLLKLLLTDVSKQKTICCEKTSVSFWLKAGIMALIVAIFSKVLGRRN